MTARLGAVALKIGSGATPRGGANVYRSDGVALIRSQNVLNSGFSESGLAYIGEKHAQQLDGVAVQAGDVLLNITGDSVARVCQAPASVLPARVNQHVAIVRPNPSALNAAFLRYVLVNPAMQAHLMGLAMSGGTRNALTKHMIEVLEVPCPPLEVQVGVGRTLGSLDDKIDVNRRMGKMLEGIARTLFQSWFVDFDPVRGTATLPADVRRLFPDRLADSSIGPIPEGWEVAPLGEHVEVTRGLSYTGAGLADEGMPLHNLNSIREGGGYKEDGIKHYVGEYRERDRVRPGDVIVANTEQGFERLLIGYPALVPRRFGEDGLYSHHIYRLHPLNGSAVTSRWLYLLLVGRPMHAQVVGYSNGTTVNMLPKDGLTRPLIALPPRELVERLDAIVTPMFDQQETLTAESKTLAELRDTLLPKLISGDMRLKDAS